MFDSSHDLSLSSRSRLFRYRTDRIRIWNNTFCLLFLSFSFSFPFSGVFISVISRRINPSYRYLSKEVFYCKSTSWLSSLLYSIRPGTSFYEIRLSCHLLFRNSDRTTETLCRTSGHTDLISFTLPPTILYFSLRYYQRRIRLTILFGNLPKRSLTVQTNYEIFLVKELQIIKMNTEP